MKRNYINPEIAVVRFAENLMDDTVGLSVYHQDVDSDDVLGKDNDFDDMGDTGFPMWED